MNRSLTRVLRGGGFENPNPMQAKTKTFIPAIVPMIMTYRQKRKDVKTADVEALELEGGAPQEGMIQNMPERPAGDKEPTTEIEEGVEYDDEDDEPGLHRPVSRMSRRMSLHSHHSYFGRHQGKDRAHWKQTAWEDIKVGDFVKIVDNESFPADILICATSEEENVCFVETKNLDGETNLKSRTASPVLSHLRTAGACADPRNQFKVDCDRPEVNLYKLNAAVIPEKGQKSSVDIQQVLLRGSVLRNTRWVIGIVLFTGFDTKIVLNSGGAPSKRSKVERQMNPQVYVSQTSLFFAVQYRSLTANALDSSTFSFWP